MVKFRALNTDVVDTSDLPSARDTAEATVADPPAPRAHALGVSEFAAFGANRLAFSGFQAPVRGDAAGAVTLADLPSLRVTEMEASTLASTGVTRQTLGFTGPGAAVYPTQPLAYDGEGQVIVVIDSGYHTNYASSQPDRLLYSYDFSLGNDADAQDRYADGATNLNSHGSWVAEVATGIAAGVDIIHLKVFADGSQFAANSDIEEALRWVVNNANTYNIAAVNLSIGGGNFTASATSSLSDELAALKARGIFNIAAAGNEGRTYPVGVNFLAADPSAIGVSASNAAGRIADWSQASPVLTDIVAFGDGVPYRTLTGGFQGAPLVGSASGTSFAAPQIAGMAAVLQEAALDILGRRLTEREFLDILQDSGVAVTNPQDYTGTGGTGTGGTGGAVRDVRLLAIAHDPVTDPGSNRRSAFNLGELLGENMVTDSFSSRDRMDVYTFSVADSGATTIALDLNDPRVQVVLLDHRGRAIARDTGAGGLQFTQTLQEGRDYSLMVAKIGGVTGTLNYQLDIDTYVPPPPVQPPVQPTIPDGFHIANVNTALDHFMDLYG